MDFLDGVSHPLPTQFNQYRQSLKPPDDVDEPFMKSAAQSLEHANAVVKAASQIADREAQSVANMCEQLGPLLDSSIEYLSEVLHLLEKMQHADIASRMFSKLEDLAEKQPAATQRQPGAQQQTPAQANTGPVRALSHDPFANPKEQPYDLSGDNTLQTGFDGFTTDFNGSQQTSLPTKVEDGFARSFDAPAETNADTGGFGMQLDNDSEVRVPRDLERDQRLVDMSYAIMNEQIETDPSAMAVLLPMPPSVSWSVENGHWECLMRGHQSFGLDEYGGFFNAYNAVFAEIEHLYTNVTDINDEEIFYESKQHKTRLVHNASLLMKYVSFFMEKDLRIAFQISAPISDSPITQGLAFNLEAAAWTVLVENEEREKEVEAYFNVKFWGDIVKGLLAAQVFRAYRSMG